MFDERSMQAASRTYCHESLRGRTMPNRRSMQSKMHRNTSISVVGAGCASHNHSPFTCLDNSERACNSRQRDSFAPGPQGGSTSE